jgi:ParB/RepB/Spo0J family partition protein
MGMKFQEMSFAEISKPFQRKKSIAKEKAAELVESIKRHGLVRPPVVDAKGQLVLGDVQLWAAQAAGLSTVPVLVDDREVSEVDVLKFVLAEDTQTLTLKPSEKVEYFKRLMELTSCSASEAAAATGTSSATVSRLFAIAGLESEFRDLVDAGQLGISKAYQLTLMKPEERMALLPGLRDGLVTRSELAEARGTQEESRQARNTVTKVKVVLDEGRTVIVKANQLDMAGYVEVISVLLRKARQAQARGVVLDDFVKMAGKAKKQKAIQA